MRLEFFDNNNTINIANKPIYKEHEAKKISFSDILSKNINEVNQFLIESQDLNEKLALGQIENVHQVVLAAQKAELAMQFTMQIRNKILDAYNEIMRMTV